jgi:hypothetical protein
LTLVELKAPCRPCPAETILKKLAANALMLRCQPKLALAIGDHDAVVALPGSLLL